MSDIEKIIADAYENRAALSPKKAPAKVKRAVEKAVAMLDAGSARVAEKRDGRWMVNEWLKKAVELRPKKFTVLEHYGDCLFKLNKVNEAIKYWEAALEAGGDKDRLSQKIKARKTLE